MNLCQNLFYLWLLTILVALTTNVNAVNNKKQDAKCLLPREPGPCRMSLNRFYYNAQTDTCEEFKFGGCMGNDNKFGFRQTCEEACKKSLTSGTATTTAAAAVATSEKIDHNSKQLNINNRKALTSVIDGSTTTTPKPTTTRTTVKSRITTPRTQSSITTTTTTQKSKPQI